MATGHVSIFGEIGVWGVTAQMVQDQISQASEADDLTVHINSIGGEVFEGYAIFNILNGLDKPVNVQIEGICASIATLIACSGDTIKMSEIGQYMVHNPQTMAFGESEDLEKQIEVLDQIKDTIISAYESKTGLSEDELSDLMDAETWLTAEEAKDKGFVDEVTKIEAKAVASINPRNFKHMKKTDKSVFDKFMSKINTVIAGIDNDIKDIKSKMEPEVKNLERAIEEGGTLIVDVEENESWIGADVRVSNEGEETVPEDGEIVLDDGTKVAVSGGQVTEVTEPEEEPVSEDVLDKMAELAESVKNLTEQVAKQPTAEEIQDAVLKNLSPGHAPAPHTNQWEQRPKRVTGPKMDEIDAIKKKNEEKKAAVYQHKM